MTGQSKSQHQTEHTQALRSDEDSRKAYYEQSLSAVSRPRLSPREREIAIGAIGARGPASPVEAAKQLLAGIAVLDGSHLPFVVWPEEMTLRQRADWLARVAGDHAESADLFDTRMSHLNPGDPQALEGRQGCAQESTELASTLQSSASSASAHPEADTDSRLQIGPLADQDSNGAC